MTIKSLETGTKVLEYNDLSTKKEICLVSIHAVTLEKHTLSVFKHTHTLTQYDNKVNTLPCGTALHQYTGSIPFHTEQSTGCFTTAGHVTKPNQNQSLVYHS